MPTYGRRNRPSDPRDVLTRPAAPPDAVLRYGDPPDQVADLWLPAPRPSAAPLVLVLHGGFWRADYDRTHVRALSGALAGAGWVVASVEYRRTGAGGGWPATFHDVALAADRLPAVVAAAAAARGLGVRARRALLGHSAGGHLALWVAARHRLPPGSPWWRAAADPALAGVVALAPVARLADAARVGLDDGAAAELMGGGPADVPERYRQADPAALLPTGVPTVLLHGSEDAQVPVGQSIGYADAARAAGDRPDLRVLPGVEHFGPIDPRSPAYTATVAALATLVHPRSPS